MNIVGGLKEDQLSDFVFTGELTPGPGAVFEDTPHEVVGDSRVQHGVVLIGHDVNAVLLLIH